MWLIAAGTSSAGLLAGCCVDLLVHAVRYTKKLQQVAKSVRA